MAAYIARDNHAQDVTAATRASAIAAVSEISDLTNERRERSVLVVSSVGRGAPQSETEDRKKAYDEAYVRWNAKVPGDLLRIRAALNLDRSSHFLDYIDGLSDAVRLVHVGSTQFNADAVAAKPGLLSIMDKCVTAAYDLYRDSGYGDNTSGQAVVYGCQFYKLYNNLIICFAEMSQILYDSVSDPAGSTKNDLTNDVRLLHSCTPPDTATEWASQFRREVKRQTVAVTGTSTGQ